MEAAYASVKHGAQNNIGCPRAVAHTHHIICIELVYAYTYHESPRAAPSDANVRRGLSAGNSPSWTYSTKTA